MGRGNSGTSLAPGFRFHPTDEELVRYYLKRKVANKPFRFDPISVIDIYKVEPWDLPGMSKLKSRDLEWYFFSALDKKYGNGSKTNRATEKGYWKTTGKDRPVHSNSRPVGMKKTLVYHIGRAPRGERTNWVMHEYRLVDQELERAGILQDAFVLCRIFQKSGTGPKNGEQYGAPFIEEEWEDDEVPLFPGEEVVVADGVAVADGELIETNDLDQKFDTRIAYEDSQPALPLNFYHGEASNCLEPSRNFIEDDQKPMIGWDESHHCSDLPDDKNLLDLPEQYELAAKSLKNEYVIESSNNVNAVDVSYFMDEPYLDATDNPPLSEGLFLEANDLSNSMEADCAGFDVVDEYLNFSDSYDENMTFDPSEIMGSENAVSDQSPLSQMNANEGTHEVSVASEKLLESLGNNEASCSKQKPNAMGFETDVKYPFIKQVSHKLGNVPAPPALASEFPIKDAALSLYPGQSSGSIHVTAGIIRTENNGIGKNGNISIILSLGLPQGDVSPASLAQTANLFSGKTDCKTDSLVLRSLIFLMIFWVLILSISYKIGTCVCTK